MDMQFLQLLERKDIYNLQINHLFQVQLGPKNRFLCSLKTIEILRKKTIENSKIKRNYKKRLEILFSQNGVDIDINNYSSILLSNLDMAQKR